MIVLASILAFGIIVFVCADVVISRLAMKEVNKALSALPPEYGEASCGDIHVRLFSGTASVMDLLSAPMWVVYGFFILAVHVILMYVLSKLFHWDLCMVSTASLANIGGAASAPIVASAYNESYAGIGVLMGVLGAAVGNFAGLSCGYVLKMMA